MVTGQNSQEPARPAQAAAYLNDLKDMVEGAGRHADHTRRQVGRCVYCSCGMRVQGRLPKANPGTTG